MSNVKVVVISADGKTPKSDEDVAPIPKVKAKDKGVSLAEIKALIEKKQKEKAEGAG